MDSAPTGRKRRSRMRRVSTGKRIDLQPRDFEILRLLVRYRYLRSTHIHRFVGGDRTKLIERLGSLYHEAGHLDRPEQQWLELGSRCQPIVYSLSKRGLAELREHFDAIGEPFASFGNGNQFRHALMVCEILAAIELKARERGVRLISWAEIRAKATQAGPVPQIRVTISHTFGHDNTEHADVMLTPDAVFGLEYAINGTKSYRFFALEADLGTMPVERKTLAQSSYLKKLLCYRQVISQALHLTVWGVPNLLVLNALPGEMRLEGVMRLLAQISNGRGSPSFLFCAIGEPNCGVHVYRRVGVPDLAIFSP